MSKQRTNERKRRRPRWPLWLALALLLPVVLAVIALSLPVGREALLRQGLRLAERRLPGEQRYAEANWPRLGTLRVADYAWTAASDTLVAFAELELELRIAPLLRRRVELAGLQLRGLRLDLPALQAALPASAAPDSAATEARPTALDLALPFACENLSVVDARLRLAPGRPPLLADLQGGLNLRAGARRLGIDSLRLREAGGPWALERGSLSADLDRREVEAVLGGRFRGLGAGLRVSGGGLDTLRFALSPLRLQADAVPSPDPAEPAGEFLLAPDLSWIRWRDLRVTGDLGQWRLTGAATADDSLRLMLAVDWPRYPAAGLEALLGDSLAAALPSQLAAHWPAADARLELSLAGMRSTLPELDLVAALALPGLALAADGRLARGDALDLRASLALPELQLFADRLPPQAAGLRGALRIDLAADARRRRLLLRAPTGLAVDGLSLDSLRLELDLPVDSLALLPLRARLAARSHELDLFLATGLDYPAGELRLDADTLGLRLGQRALNSRGPFRLSLFPERQSLAVDALRLRGSMGTLDLDGTWAAAGADLACALDLDLPAAELAALAPNLASGNIDSLRLSGAFRIEGRLGRPRLRGELRVAAHGPDFDLPRAELTLREEGSRQLGLRLPDGARYRAQQVDSLDLDLVLPADTLALLPLRGALRASSPILGLVLGVRASSTDEGLLLQADSLALRLGWQSLSAQQPFSLLRSANGGLRIADLRLVGELGSVSANGGLDGDVADLVGAFDLRLPAGLPARLLPNRPDFLTDSLALSVAARFGAQGSVLAPELSLEASIDAEDASADRHLGLEIALARAPGSRSPLLGTLLLRDDLGRLIGGEFDLPGELDLRARRWRADATQPMRLSLGPDSLALARIAAYVPPRYALAGVARVELGLAGLPDSLRLAGGLRSRDLELRWDERRSWVAAAADLELGGAPSRPALRGRVETRSGVIQLPGVPRPLLPDAGEALLWNAGLGRGLAADSIAAPAAVARSRGPLPDLELELVAPGGLWLRRQGIELELGGDLSLRRGNREPLASPPRLDGELQLIGGRVQFLGRRFEVARGSATFFGERDPDPALDLELVSQLAETRVSIEVGGTMKAPTFALRSEPEHSQEEILALLLSGGASEEGGAEPGAQQQLQGAATGLLSALGVARLQKGITWGGGVDQLEYRRGGEGQAGSLMLGKYLGPRLLLQYEQGLEETGDFVLHLRYLLSRRWRLESSYAQLGARGLELHWSRED